MAAPGSVLRVLTCGSVDDGKSTLIGRLLFEFGALPDDVVAALVRDSRRFGTVGEGVDYALLVDGLAAEREQGVTIDVAYRFFETPGGDGPGKEGAGRRFILADTPGHEQYTCNMVTGASTADVAVLLVDVSRGVLAQTRRHLAVVWLMGIRQVVLAVNKMDLVGFAPEAFHAVCRDFAALLPALPGVAVTAIPICARDGDNVVEPGGRMGWHAGPTVLGALVAAPGGSIGAGEGQPFRMPVQLVVRPDASFRGYAGTVAAGVIRPGDVVCNAASGVAAGVRAIVTMDGERGEAQAGDAVTLVLDREIDVSRGDVLAQAPAPPCADEMTAWLVWMAEAPLLPGRAYSVRLGTAAVTGTVTSVLGRLEMERLQERGAEQLGRNEIGRVVISLTQRLVCEAYAKGRTMGGFILVDRISGATLGAGMVLEARSRPVNVHWHRLDVDKAERAGLKGQRPCILWFTGLSASGKSTIANLVERRLVAMGRHSMVLDGDNVRHGLNRDLGFSEKDRVENIRRIAETAKLFVEAGLIVLVSFISPYRQERGMARDLVEAGEFLEVFVDTPIAECRRRDPKGLYAKADAGEVRNFTGVDAPYEPPLAPELVLSTVEHAAEALAEQVVAELVLRGVIV